LPAFNLITTWWLIKPGLIIFKQALKHLSLNLAIFKVAVKIDFINIFFSNSGKKFAPQLRDSIS
jgi:hypothetical protein